MTNYIAMKRRLVWLLGASFPALMACASTKPSQQLVNARQVYTQARNSQAAEIVPSDVVAARQALDRAERAHDDDARSYDEISLAYVAQRQAELAMVNANQALTRRRIAAAQEEYARMQARARERAEAELAASASTGGDDRLARAQQELAGVCTVSQGPEGMVFTMEEAVLFSTGKSDLMPTAEERLTRVASFLKQMQPDSNIEVEGHTDNVGKDETNMRLSQQRADSVKNFLIMRGISETRISAVGKGESEPMASNDSVEDRAVNRRVEIVVK